MVVHQKLCSFFTILDNSCKINNKQLPFTINNRLMLAKLTYPVEAHIINAYHQANHPENFENIKNIPSLIMGGDFNSYITPTLDAFSSATTPNRKPRPVEAILHNGYIDIFRALHPEARKFSRYGSSKSQDGTIHISGSRIDYFFISHSHISSVEDIYIDEYNTFESDHRAVTLILSSEEIPAYFREEPYTTRINTGDNAKWNNEFKNKLNEYVDRLFSPTPPH